MDEDDAVDANHPPLDTYRKNIVRVVKVGPTGNIKFDVDLDTARHDFDSGAEMIVNPMVAATARLAIGGGEIALVHGINTDPDPNINGARHQKALSTRLNSESGAITKTSSIWCSHSFDQRLFFDGEGMIEYHLGDAYPRYIVFAKKHKSYPVFHIKGNLGENNTRTRLGDIARIDNDPAFGYITLFATESSTETNGTISGPRNLAMVRVHKSDHTPDPDLPDTLEVMSSGQKKMNTLKWLTDYQVGSDLHAERPKLVGVGSNRYIVLWEQWQAQVDGRNDRFMGVFGMVINDEGKTIASAKHLTDQYHLHRGDDAFLLDGKAAWMTGNKSQKELYIHLVDTTLQYEKVTLR